MKVRKEPIILCYLAYNTHNKGEISVRLIEKHNTYTLIVKDDGIGFNTKKSVGSKLVETLLKEQLNGTLRLKSVNNTKYHITFSLP